MLDYLLQLDQQCLLAINGAHAPWADTLMWHVSQSATWLPLYAVMLVLLWYHIPITNEKKAPYIYARIATFALFILMFAVAVGGADLICARIIKPLVARPRPTHDMAIGSLVHIVNGYTGGAYGFCSNHAANTMATALLFCLIYLPNKNWIVRTCVIVTLLLWVLINCYSRMYLGVHYPLDIIAGLIVGILTALVAWGVPLRFFARQSKRANSAAEE